MLTSLPAPHWRPMPRQSHVVPVAGLVVLTALMFVVAIAPLLRSVANAAASVGPAVSFPASCVEGVAHQHVVLSNSGTAAATYTVSSRIDDRTPVIAAHDVPAGDVTILDFVVPAGSTGAFVVVPGSGASSTVQLRSAPCPTTGPSDD